MKSKPETADDGTALQGTERKVPPGVAAANLRTVEGTTETANDSSFEGARTSALPARSIAPATNGSTSSGPAGVVFVAQCVGDDLFERRSTALLECRRVRTSSGFTKEAVTPAR
jgi:hypothetical protein